MKTLLCAFTLLFCGGIALANLPYMPLIITLQPQQSEFIEGEKISFIVWIKNTDKTTTYPVLLPDGQNTGEKLFYLQVADAANNYYRIVAKENRQMKNRAATDVARVPKVVKLAPGDSVSFTINWNAGEDFMLTQNHHSFNVPITAGHYYFQGFYNPYGTLVGDTLYNFITSTNDKTTGNKLTFWQSGNPTFPVEIIIKNTDKKKITVENIEFRVDKEREGQYVYYISDSVVAKRIFRYPNGQISSEFTSNYLHGDPGSMDYKITYFENGNISDYYVYDKNSCPSIIFRRTFFGDDLLQFSAEEGPQGTFIETWFNNEKVIEKQNIYAADRLLLTNYEYNPKSGELQSTKKQKNPCNDVAELGSK
jgi:hypothetical protein